MNRLSGWLFASALSLGISAALADQAQSQRFQVDVAPLRFSGKAEQPVVGGADRKSELIKSQHYEIEVTPLRISGKSEGIPIGGPERQDPQNSRQRFEIQVVPLQISGEGERMRLPR